MLPGLINTHHHFYQTLTRAVPAALDRELFPWLQALYPIWARLTPEALDLGMTLAMAELMLSGCTTTTDHHYVFPAGLEDSIDIEVEAAQRLGLRVLLTRGSMNLSQRDGGLPPDSVVQDEDTILADSERVVARYHEAGDGAMVQIALAPCSPFSVTTSLMRSTAELAQRLDVRLHTHLAETEDENRFCQEMHNCRPLDYLEDCGWLNDRTWLAHGIHFDAGEIKRLARAGTTISHCRVQQSDAGVGDLPGVRHGRGRHARRPRRRRLGLERRVEFDAGGSRGVPAAAQPLRRRQGQPPRCAALGDRRLRGVRRHGPTSARSRPARMADFALFKLDELRFSGSGDPLAALVLCGAHRADRVMVGGRWIVENGQVPGLTISLDAHSAGIAAAATDVTAQGCATLHDRSIPRRTFGIKWWPSSEGG